MNVLSHCFCTCFSYLCISSWGCHPSLLESVAVKSFTKFSFSKFEVVAVVIDHILYFVTADFASTFVVTIADAIALPNLGCSFCSLFHQFDQLMGKYSPF